MTPACLYLHLELSLCELYCNGYVLYPFIRLNHSSIQRIDRKIFQLNDEDTIKKFIDSQQRTRWYPKFPGLVPPSIHQL
jgi:hypothetical protein